MAKIETYPIVTAQLGDYIIGTDREGEVPNQTVNFLVSDIVALANSGGSSGVASIRKFGEANGLNGNVQFEAGTGIQIVQSAVGDVIPKLTISLSGLVGSKWTDAFGGVDIYRNSKVGIGDFSSAAPSEALEVQGKIEVSGADGEFIGDLRGAVRFKAEAGEALSKGDVVYISGVSGNTPVVMKANATNAAKMPAFGLAFDAANLNASVEVVTFGTLDGLDTQTPGWSVGDTLYVGAFDGVLTSTPPTGEVSLLQNIGKVQRLATNGNNSKLGCGNL